MLDLQEISRYQENNRIEAKKATGGFPHSLWETYSAFANTLGGVILLGVEEWKDKSFHPVQLPDPQWLADTFWQQVNDSRIASCNMIEPEQVRIAEAEGQRIVVIEVPRAARWQRPVYVGTDMYQGTYQRTGEGDYRCNRQEIDNMLAQRQTPSFDMELVETASAADLDAESTIQYEQLLKKRHGQWAGYDSQTLLLLVGVLGRDKQGNVHPTRAGLLLLGRGERLAEIFPGYCLMYREKLAGQRNWQTVLTTERQDWPGNLFAFYQRAARRLCLYVAQMDLSENEQEAVAQSLQEGLANGLLHADYARQRRVVVSQRPGAVLISNSGGLRQNAERLLKNSMPAPQNELLVQLFHKIGIGHGMGSGLSGIVAVWKKQGWLSPQLGPYLHTDSTALTLFFSSEDGELVKEMQQDQLVDYITLHITVTVLEAAKVLRVSLSVAKSLLHELLQKNILEQENGQYRLKA